MTDCELLEAAAAPRAKVADRRADEKCMFAGKDEVLLVGKRGREICSDRDVLATVVDLEIRSRRGRKRDEELILCACGMRCYFSGAYTGHRDL